MAMLHPLASLSAELFSGQPTVCVMAKIDWPEALALVSLDLLSESERHRAKAFRDETARASFILGRSITRRVLSLVTGRAALEIGIVLDTLGKPEAKHAGWHFSISHSGPWVAVAFAPVAVGCDLELGLRLGTDGLLGIAGQVFCDEELAALALLANQPLAQRALFLQIWRSKEAILKAAGLGFAGAPRTLCVLDETGNLNHHVAYGGRTYEVTVLSGPALPEVALAKVTVCADPTPAPATPR